MQMRRVLVTSPPLCLAIDRYNGLLSRLDIEVHPVNAGQTLSRSRLLSLVAEFDGWIIGDDQVDTEVLATGRAGRLRAAVKWGIGVDNIDFDAAKSVGIPIRNTPDMFGDEIADLAMHYVTGLARETYRIHEGVKKGNWPKPAGISLTGRTAAVVGYGSVGRAVVDRLLAARMQVLVYTRTESKFNHTDDTVQLAQWPARIQEAEFVVLCCPLTDQTRHLLGRRFFETCFDGVRIVNVARGGVIDTNILCEALRTGHAHSAALDVFEQEPLPMDAALRDFDQVVLGSHNASNTIDAVDRTSRQAIETLVTLWENTGEDADG
ncbi:MAG: phosphoglycerate dehydrogenase [Aureliella sp.]